MFLTAGTCIYNYKVAFSLRFEFDGEINLHYTSDTEYLFKKNNSCNKNFFLLNNDNDMFEKSKKVYAIFECGYFEKVFCYLFLQLLFVCV